MLCIGRLERFQSGANAHDKGLAAMTNAKRKNKVAGANWPDHVLHDET